ncbi:MAG: cytochrome c oxidase subunit 3 [Anaerolineae bacterium]|nr:cytochrome c oxidase subunit 3 [Anaerolineae bacterium]MBN8619202.1 cytochrome c oxidase subunit 3 [Anaerolineae bacterium]
MSQKTLEQGLSRHELQDLRNKRTGLAIFQISWIMTFVCLIIVNFWMRSSQPAWPPAGVEVDVFVPTLMTIALIASSFFMRRGVKALKANAIEQFTSAWRIGLGFGVVFAVVMAYEFITAPGSGQYRDVYRLMVGFHHVHALAIGYYLIRVYQNGRAGHYSPTNFWPVEGGASLWDFVTVAWVLFYVVLYLI